MRNDEDNLFEERLEGVRDGDKLGGRGGDTREDIYEER